MFAMFGILRGLDLPQHQLPHASCVGKEVIICHDVMS